MQNNEISMNTNLFMLNLTSVEWQMITLPNNYSPRISGGLIHDNHIYLINGINLYQNITRVSQISLLNFNVTETLDPYSISEYSYTSFSGALYIYGGKNPLLSNSLLTFSPLTLNFSELSPNSIFPSSRENFVFQVMTQNIYMFGGKSSEGYLNDLWKMQVYDETWEKIFAFGDIPEERSEVASLAQGNYLLIFGGKGKKYFNDLFRFKASNNTWIKILPQNGIWPLPRSAACAVFYKGKVYIYGGKNDSGIFDELWTFDLKTSEYSFIGNSKLFYPKNFCYLQENLLIVISSDEQKFERLISIFDLTTQIWLQSFSVQVNSIKSIDILVKNTLLFVGGTLYGNIIKTSVDMYNLTTNQFDNFDINFGTVNSNFVYLNNFLYIFGGYKLRGKLFLENSYTNALVKFDLFSVYNENICSEGSFFTKDSYLNNLCTLCPVGTYNSVPYSEYCNLCPEGTYSTLMGLNSLEGCYLCSSGYWNNDTGQSFCRDCPINKYCPFGSIFPTNEYTFPLVSSIQPPEFVVDTSLYNNYIGILMYSSGITVFLIMVILIFSKNLRDKLHLLDMYTSKHNHKLLVPMYIKKTNFGGFCTIIFIVVIINFSTISLMKFYMVNTIETRALLPISTLPEVSEINSDLTITSSFYYYGGTCVTSTNKCSEEIIMKGTSINGFLSYYCMFLEKDICEVVIACTGCSFTSESMVEIVLQESKSFCSVISINLTSTSSIPHEISSYTAVVYSDEGFFFGGIRPTQYIFSLIPSIFQASFINNYGYHVNMEKSPIKGEETSSSDLFYSSEVSVQILLSRSDSCLFISRGFQTSMLELFSALVGTIFGLMSTVGGVLNISEKHLDNFLEWTKHKNILSYYRKRIINLVRIINPRPKPNERNQITDLNGSTFAKEVVELELTQLNK